MLKNYILTIILLFGCCFCKAQVPEPTILTMETVNGNNSEIISSRIITTGDVGFITILKTGSDNGNVAALCGDAGWRTIFTKHNSDASQVEWKRCYKSKGDTTPEFIYPLPNERYIIGNRIKTSAVSLQCEDNIGNLIWGPKVYGGSAGELFRDLIRTSDGGYLFLVGTNSDDGDVGKHYGGAFNNDMWALKVDSLGVIEWSSVFGGTDEEYPVKAIEIPNSKGFYLIGYTYSTDDDCTTNHGGADLFIVRVDNAGNKIWGKCYGGTEHDGANSWVSATIDSPDKLLVVMHTASVDGDVNAPIGYSGLWLADIDTSGNILWSKTYGGKDATEYPKSICYANDATIWIGGISHYKNGIINNEYGKSDACVLHFDVNGNFLSSKSIGTSAADYLNFVHPIGQDLIFSGGEYKENDGVGLPNNWLGGQDVFLMKIAPWTTNISQTQTDLNKLNIYPNPTTHYLHIQLNTSAQLLQIFNVSGRTIYSAEQPKNNTKLNTSKWANGTYLIQLTDAEGVLHKKAVIKQ